MKRTTNRSAGFTLIEACIAIVIFAIMAVMVGQMYDQYLQRQKIDITNQNLTTITEAIGSFRQANGYYPAPASLTLPRTDPFYGRMEAADCKNNVTADGIYMRQTSASGQIICIGAIPFRQLNLDESTAYDGYHNRYFYAVTAQLTVSATFSESGGGITIDNSNNAASPLTNNAHFFIFSTGADGAGAFSQAGGGQNPCPAPANALEGNNCTLNSGVPIPFVSAPRGTASNNQKFDDITDYFTLADMPLWQYSDTNYKNINVKPTNSNVTLNGANNPGSAVAKLVVPGTVTAESGLLMASNFCDPSSTYTNPLCNFPPSLFAGTLASGGGMQCPANKPYLKQIVGGAAVCTNEVYSWCPPKSFMTGLDGNGKMVCGAPACPPITVGDDCDSIQTTLPYGDLGNTYPVTAGDSWVQAYACGASGWQKSGSSSGVCQCTAGTVVGSSTPCSNWLLYLTGTYTETTTTTCRPKTVINSYGGPMPQGYPPTCQCNDGYVWNWSSACPTGDTGDTYGSSQAWSCAQNKWILQSSHDDCTCTPINNVISTQPANCPSGGGQYTETIKTSTQCSTASAATNGYSPTPSKPTTTTTIISSTESTDCQCSTSRTVQQSVPCPDGSSGGFENCNETGNSCTGSWSTPGTGDCSAPIYSNCSTANQGTWKDSGQPYTLAPSPPPSYVTIGAACTVGSANQNFYNFYQGSYSIGLAVCGK